MPRHDIKLLEKKVDSLSNALAKLGNEDDFQELVLIWKRPGWTTPAEFTFVSAILDTMNAEVKTLGELKTSLLRGSKEVIATKQAAG